jgi:hypothetical protein
MKYILFSLIFLASLSLKSQDDLLFKIDPFENIGYLNYTEGVVKISIVFPVVYNEELKEYFTDSSYQERAIRKARIDFGNIVNSSLEQLQPYEIYKKLGERKIEYARITQKDERMVEDLNKIKSDLDEGKAIQDIITSITKNRLGAVLDYLILKDN